MGEQSKGQDTIDILMFLQKEGFVPMGGGRGEVEEEVIEVDSW